MQLRQIGSVFAFACATIVAGLGGCATAVDAPVRQAAAATRPAAAPAPARIDFTQETLANGLRVIYAPLHQSPVVHVRVLYHVGSRDERPDRQGFAHMFEHMMFRGSAHVQPQEHMKLIGVVGGYSNAYTSFDQTVYVNTVPANQVELALYLEADRMASFRVCDEIFQTERRVVAEEWRIRENRPYGRIGDDFFALAYARHSYRWTPIGNMDHLAAARARELQDFFNTYYVPNNAILVIAGDMDVAATRALVKRYFSWIPRGNDVARHIPAEPPGRHRRQGEVAYAVPLWRLMIGYRTPGYGSSDQYALDLLGQILGQGDSSRLARALVHGDQPSCMQAAAHHAELGDSSQLFIQATILAGKDIDRVEAAIQTIVADIRQKGVTQEELDRARMQYRVRVIRDRQTAEDLADQLGQEALYTARPERVNQVLNRIDALTRTDIARAARRYLRPENLTVLRIRPDSQTKAAPPPASRPADTDSAPSAAGQPMPVRQVVFPKGYPARPPVADSRIDADFQKGTETILDGVRVIVMPDHRLPLVSWGLTIRCGSHCEPAGKEGLGDLTAGLVQRGAGGLDYAQLSRDLESRGIQLDVHDGGDYTRLSGSCTTDQLDHAMLRARQVLRAPSLPVEEFRKLQDQTVNALRVSQESPREVARSDLAAALYGASALGRQATPQSVASLSLEDVKDYYQRVYRPHDAFLLLCGDVTVQRGQALARQLLDGWQPQDPPTAEYAPAEPVRQRLLILVDRPEGKQSTICMGLPSYTCHSEQRYAGDVVGRILSSGIDSRLGQYVRAEKGLAYGVYGLFAPGRHAGEFQAGTETSLETTGQAIEAIFKVLADVRSAGVTAEELAQAKTRVAGGMVLGMQTIDQQARLRAQAILNGYPPDYYDTYATKISAVTTGQIQALMQRYVRDDRFTIVVVAPAARVESQLKVLGDLQIIPMPARRAGMTVPASQPAAQPPLRPAA